MPLPTKTLVNRMSREEYLGNSANGPKWGPKRDKIPCRLINRRSRVTNENGDTVVSTCVVHTRPDVKLATMDRVFIDGQRYEVLDITPLTGPIRIEGWEAMLG